MTDLIDAPGAGSAAGHMGDDAAPPDAGDRPLQWAPREPAPKKRHVGLWIGLTVGALVLAAGAASTILIAPGTTIAGIPVGGLTPGAAADVVASHLADTEVTLTDVNADVVLTGADLGASLDARALAEEAFATAPAWNLGTWMSTALPGGIVLDPSTAERTLRAAVPASYEDAVDATVVFDEKSHSYITTPAESGTGIDIDALTAAITAALSDGAQSLTFSGAPTESEAAITDEKAQATAEDLNGMLDTVGFYVGEERTVPVSAQVAARWLTIEDVDGRLEISADPAAIQKVVDTLPKKVNRKAVDARAVVDSAGTVLRELNAGEKGRKLADTTGIAAAFAEQLALGDAVYPLEVTETAFENATVLRTIEVNLSAQRAYLFENGEVIESYAISSGLPGTPTPTGNFTVFAHTASTDMGCYEGAPYCTEDVPWNTWFAPDIAFHGAYWHNNFGHQMSHGCVNMPVHVAKHVYDWAPVGMEVSVHW